VAITDTGGSILIATEASDDSAGPVLAAGEEAGFSLQFANWCQQGAALPGHVLFVIARGGIDIADLALSTADDLPPCNGPDQPATLTASEWATG
jgi:hypothetical protein